MIMWFKMNVLYVIFLRHDDQIKLWIFCTRSSNGKQVVTQEDLEERYEIWPTHSCWVEFYTKPYERFSCRQKRAVEQEVGTASGNSFLYLHAIFVYQPYSWLYVWPTYQIQ